MQHLKPYWLAFVALSFSTALFGQEFTGQVTDTSNAAVPKATIRVHNQSTNVDITTVTTKSGDYTVPYLKPGIYTVSAQADGFEKQSKTNITLQVDQTAKINFLLTVGSVVESVTVTADALVDLGKADVGEVVENTRVSELPLNGRDPSTLAQLSAGVNWYGGKNWTRPFDQTEGALDINGGGTGNTVLMLDGISNETASGNAQVAYIPPVDAVQEFKIITNPYDAQFGRGQGGVIDMTLKSGTNTLHGDAYEFARRTWLDSNTWQNANAGKSTPQHKLDQAGGELDGPIFIPKVFNGRDKAFFLLQYENWNEIAPNTVTTSVPMDGWLDGNFGNLTYFDPASGTQKPLVIYDPTTIQLDPTTGIYVRSAFKDNIIPQERINQVAKAILSYYPKSNFGPRAGQNPYNGNYVVQDPITDIYRNIVAKADYNVTSSDRFTLRYGYWERWQHWLQNAMPGFIAQMASPTGTVNQTYMTEWVHTFTPKLVFDFKAVATTYVNNSLAGPRGFDQTTLGLPASLVSQYSPFNTYFPNISLSEFDGIGNGGGNITPDESLVVNPSVTWIKGTHTIHAGIDMRFLQQAQRIVGGGMSFSTSRNWTQAQWNQGDSASGNAIASFLLGTPDSGSVTISPTVFWSQHYFAPFIQDDWKVSRRLTLNLGFRYDLNGPQSERHNRADYAFDTTSTNPVDSQVNHALMPAGMTVKGGPTFLGVNGNPTTFYAVVKTNIQPRIGFAYALDDKTAIRGGYGIMFRNPIPGGNQDGFYANTSFVSSFDGGIHLNPSATIDNPFPNGIVHPAGSALGMETGLGQSGLWFINPQYKTPRYESYSLGFERQFLKRGTLNVTYSGSRSTRQDSSDDINHVSLTYMEMCNPALGGIPEICWADPGANLANPFFDVPAFQGSAYYSSPTISSGAFTRLLPAFGDIEEYQLNEGRSWYNSLQVTGMHKMSDSLTLHGTWTWSKTMDSGGFSDTNYRILSRTLDSNDITHRITISGVYMLPVGHNRALLTNSNRAVDAVVGGWELGSLYIFETGHPWQFSGLDYLHDAKVPRHTDPSIPGSIRGAAPCVGQWHEISRGQWDIQPYAAAKGCVDQFGVVDYDFIAQAPWGPQPNIVYSGIRIPNYQQLDANLSKNFKVYERLGAQLRLEGFNVPNHPVFQSGYDSNPSDPQFGCILKQNGQSNVPRQVQIALKLLW